MFNVDNNISYVTYRPNILLDRSFVAEVGDFGFALELPKCVSGCTLVTAPIIARTNGYMAPETMHGRISPKSDIYSYGIVSVKCYCRAGP